MFTLLVGVLCSIKGPRMADEYFSTRERNMNEHVLLLRSVFSQWNLRGPLAHRPILYSFGK